MSIDQNVVNAGILEQRLQRTQAEYLVLHLGDDALSLVRGEQRLLVLENAVCELGDILGDAVLADLSEPREIDVIEQAVVYAGLELLVLCIALGRLLLLGALVGLAGE